VAGLALVGSGEADAIDYLQSTLLLGSAEKMTVAESLCLYYTYMRLFANSITAG
jgi:hypothetical protein